MADMQVIDTPQAGMARMMEIRALERQEEAARAAKEEAARTANRDFTQVYPAGWRRLQGLIQSDPAAARIYSFLAEHIDPACGAVVVSQAVMAEMLGLHERTIRRITKRLEEAHALVRIRVACSVYAYALDPAEVWKSWDEKKEFAAFRTKTLVKKSDRENGVVNRKLQVMLSQQELPL